MDEEILIRIWTFHNSLILINYSATSQLPSLSITYPVTVGGENQTTVVGERLADSADVLPLAVLRQLMPSCSELVMMSVQLDSASVQLSGSSAQPPATVPFTLSSQNTLSHDE